MVIFHSYVTNYQRVPSTQGFPIPSAASLGDREHPHLPSGRRTAAIGWTLVILVERMVFFKHLGEIINAIVI